MESETSTEELEVRAVDLLMGIEDTPEETVETTEEAPEEVAAEEVEEVAEEVGEEVEEEVEEEPEGDELVEFEFEGQLIEATVPIKEALMRQADYTQKTQEVAEQRKTVEIVQAEVETQKKHYEFAQEAMPEVLKAQQLDTNVADLNRYLRENIESLPHSETMKIQLAIEDAKKERDEIVGTITQRQQEFQQAQEQTREELLKKGTEVLKSKFTDWGEVAEKQVREQALSEGFTEAEIANVLDPRQVSVLYKAAQYDALKANAPSAVKTAKNAPRIASKTRNPMPKETQDKLNLRKKLKSNTLSQRDKKQAVIDDIGKRWG